jgi:hypothetical protein
MKTDGERLSKSVWREKKFTGYIIGVIAYNSDTILKYIKNIKRKSKE